MCGFPLLAFVGLASASELADPPITLKPIIDARPRYEHVEQAPLTIDADGLTMRIRAGFEAKAKDWSFLGESETVPTINPAYKSGVNGKTVHGWKKKLGLDEIDAQAVFKKGKYTALLKYADYRADTFGTDTRKFWAPLEWAI